MREIINPGDIPPCHVFVDGEIVKGVTQINVSAHEYTAFADDPPWVCPVKHEIRKVTKTFKRIVLAPQDPLQWRQGEPLVYE